MGTLYPAALDNDDSLYIAVNGLRTKLVGAHNSSVTTLNVVDTTGAAASGYVTVEGEVVHYTAKTPTTLTGCTRHDDGTSPASHLDQAVVKFGLVAAHHNSLAGAVKALEAKVGSGATGIDGAQMKDASIGAQKLITVASDAGSFKVRGYRTGAQSLSSATGNVVQINTLSGADPNTMLDTAAFKVTCKKAGRYAVKGCMTIQCGASTKTNVFVSVYKNGTEAFRGEQVDSFAANSTPSLIFGDDIDLAVNDYLQVIVYLVGTGGSMWTPSTGQFNYIAAALLP